MPILTQYTESKPSATGNPHPALPFYPNSFSESQALQAIEALVAHHTKHRDAKEGEQLVLKEEHIWLTVALKEVPKSKSWSAKPVRITVPFPPLPPPPITTVALIVKPPQRQYKDLIFNGTPLPTSTSSTSTSTPSSGPIKFITRVLDTTKLRGKHAPFEARRALCASYDVWLCDERVLPSLGKLLGKTWLDARKQPVPVNLGRKDLKGELARAVGSAVFIGSKGTANAIRIATPTHHTPTQILQNLLTVIPQIMHLVPNGWNNVLSLGIKTSGSVLLPIWRCELGVRYEEWREKPVGNEVEKKIKEVVAPGGKGDADVVMIGESEEAPGKTAKSPKSKKGKQPEVPAASAPIPAPIAIEAKPSSKTTQPPKKVLAGKSTSSAVDKKRSSSSSKSAAGGGASAKQRLIGKAAVKSRK